MSNGDPYSVLRGYLDNIGAPSEAMGYITQVLGWRPPPIWEAPRAQADAINKSVAAPEGMRHVGWYCEHPLSDQSFERLNPHRVYTNKNKRGWALKKNTARALSFGDYDAETACPQRTPVFIREGES